jgi:hypothetical protein
MKVQWLPVGTEVKYDKAIDGFIEYIVYKYDDGINPPDYKVVLIGGEEASAAGFCQIL